MEFHGDYWHGNPICYSAKTLNKVVGMTMGYLYQRTLEKRKYLESLEYTYLQMWEYDFDRAIESTEEMKSFIEHLEIASPLHAQTDEDTDIKYFDVTSLYPFINKTGKIPLGRPQIVTKNFDLLQNYEGFIKCRILPPRHLYMPVLPMKINNKLLFGLCLKIIWHPPERIVWLYKRWQPLYDVIHSTVYPKVEFIQGISLDLDQDSFLVPKRGISSY